MPVFMRELSEIVKVEVGNICVEIREQSYMTYGSLSFKQGEVLASISFETFEPLVWDTFGSLVITSFRKENPFSLCTTYKYEAILVYGKETKQLMKSLGEFF